MALCAELTGGILMGGPSSIKVIDDFPTFFCMQVVAEFEMVRDRLAKRKCHTH